VSLKKKGHRTGFNLHIPRERIHTNRPQSYYSYYFHYPPFSRPFLFALTVPSHSFRFTTFGRGPNEKGFENRQAWCFARRMNLSEYFWKTLRPTTLLFVENKLSPLAASFGLTMWKRTIKSKSFVLGNESCTRWYRLGDLDTWLSLLLSFDDSSGPLFFSFSSLRLDPYFLLFLFFDSLLLSLTQKAQA
jgi:hypothetical protein